MTADLTDTARVDTRPLTMKRFEGSTIIGSPNYVSYLDSNGDGAINGLDLAAFRTHFGTNLP